MPLNGIRAAIKLSQCEVIGVGPDSIRYDAGRIRCGIDNKRIILKADIPFNSGIENIGIDGIGKKDEYRDERYRTSQMSAHALHASQIASTSTQSYMP